MDLVTAVPRICNDYARRSVYGLRFSRCPGEADCPVRDIPPRVVAKVEWHAGELFPRVGFIVTNLRWKSGNVVRFYNKRGTAEQWIKEGKYALNWTRLSCHDFVDNQVRLQLFALAYNLGNFLGQLTLAKPAKKWSLRTLRAKLIKLIKIGAKVVRGIRGMLCSR
jgi:hypothetical protein